MDKRWSQRTKESVTRKGRAAQGTLRTFRNGAQKLTRNIRQRFHGNYPLKGTSKKTRGVASRPQNKVVTTEKQPLPMQQKVPKIVADLLQSEVQVESSQDQRHKLSTGSFPRTTRRDSSTTRMSQTTIATSVDRASLSRFKTEEPVANVTLPLTDDSSSGTRKTLAKEEAERPITPNGKSKTWPKEKGEASISSINREDAEELKIAKNNIFLVPEESMTVHPPHDTSCQPVEEDGKHEPMNHLTVEVSRQLHPNIASKPRLRTKYSPTDMTMRLKLVNMQRQCASLRLPNDSGQFVKLWEMKLLPALKRELGDIKGGFSINVLRAEEPGHRIIDVMTKTPLGQERKDLLEAEKVKCLPSEIHSKIGFQFREGKIEFATSPEALSLSSDDSWDSPVNVRRYTNPVMGDSVGPVGIQASATLGPLLKIRDKVYWLLNWHTFDDKGINRSWSKDRPPHVQAIHPSEDDLRQYSQNQQGVPLGQPVAFSGRMYQTSRPTRSVRNHCEGGGDVHFANDPLAVTDWVLFEASTQATNAAPNKVRIVDTCSKSNSFMPNIIHIADPVLPCCSPNQQAAWVYSTGRSSGICYGQICEVLGCYQLPNSPEARPWAVEGVPGGQAAAEAWRLGSMGIPGDSGAGVIDVSTNKLLGQLWGRNCYKGDPEFPRVTYFTAMSDLYDDIQDKMELEERPTLPTDMILDSISERPDATAAESHTNLHSQAAGHSFAGARRGASHSFGATRRSSTQAEVVAKKISELFGRVVVTHASSW